MLKISYPDCFGVSPAILVQFTLEMHVAGRNHKKFTKTRYFGGHSRSSMLTFPVLVMITLIACIAIQHAAVCREGKEGER